MKKITLWLFALFTCWQVNAQVSSYSFASGATGTLDPMTASTQLVASGSDDGVSPVTNIGFTFNYAGVNYTQFSANANGLVRLGATVVTSQWTNSAANANTATPVIMPYWDDLATGTTGSVRYVLTGSAPNQKLIIEWFVTVPRNTGGAANARFQCILNESTNVIEFVYGAGMVANTTNSGASIGLATNTTTFNTVDVVANTNSIATFTTNNTAAITSGTTYTWTPPTCGSPSGFVASAITSSAATIAWNTAFPVPSTGYEYYYSDVNTPPAGAGTAVAAVTANLSGLTANTLYYVWLRSDCGGGTFSAWAGPFTFRTACNAFTVPFTEGFNSTSSTEACWNILNVNADAYAWSTNYATNPFEGDQAAMMYTDGNGGVNNDWLISPTITLTGNQRLKFQYRVQSATDPNDFELLLSTTGNTPASFTNVLMATASYNNITYVERIVDLSAYSGNANIAWHIPNGGLDGWRLYIDNVIVEDIPSCVEPNSIIASNITSSSVDLSWTDGSGGLQFDYEYAIQAPGTGIPTGAGAPINDVTVLAEGFDINGNPLTANTLYEVYVRADCSGGSFSTWVGPITFRTACEAITVFPHTEDFEADNPCWTNLQVSGADNWVRDAAGGSGDISAAHGGTGFMEKNYNSSEALLFSPAFDFTALGTDGRVRVWLHRHGSADVNDEYTVYVNTSKSLTGATQLLNLYSLTTVSPTVSSTGWYEYVMNIPSSFNSSNNVYIIFQGLTSAGFSSYDLGVDDFVLEALPATAPSCASNIVATPNASCGNFANSITWDATPNADGYYITVGTTSGGTDVANASSITTNTYSFSGNIGTTYFYTIVPFNAIGSATGCTEQSFTTNASGCYCVSAPTSVDGTGITNVQLVATNFANTVSTSPVYNDHTATVVDMSQGISNSVQITFNTDSFGTSYDYNTVIWIDVNDNFTFEPSEIVFTGVSAAVSPTILNASFVMPGTAPLGQHRMRIVATDALQTPANPCFSGSYGETADFTVNVVAATCTPPAATTSIVPACGTTQFSIDVNVTALGSGTPSISDGTTTWPISAIGVVNVGPFASGSSVTLTLLHGSDVTCNLPLGSLTYSCPPANDDCANAIALTPGGVFGDNDIVGTNAAATASAGETAPGCASYLGGDVWYSAVVPASGSLTFELNTSVGGITDGAGAVYSGTCGSLVLLGCNDSASSDPNDQPLVSVTGRTPGEVLYFRVWEYGNNVFGTFLVSAYDASLSSGSFDNTNFSAYPNPVKDVLNVSYTSEISSVKIINMLGQEVISKNINATSSQIDMSQLSAGTYIVNVTVGDTIKTLKVVKQ